MLYARHVIKVNLQPTYTTGWITDSNTEFCLPGWQRGYVWTAEQAVELLRSMMLGYPLGAFILLEMDGPPWNRVAVLDGQQRITTLQGALIPGSKGVVHPLAFDAEADDFVVTAEPGPLQIPIPVLLDGMARFRWFRKSPFWTSEDLRENLQFARICEVEDSLRSHMSPVYVIERGAAEEHVREAFRRLNTMGAPLDEGQIEALFAKADAEALKER